MKNPVMSTSKRTFLMHISNWGLEMLHPIYPTTNDARKGEMFRANATRTWCMKDLRKSLATLRLSVVVARSGNFSTHGNVVSPFLQTSQCQLCCNIIKVNSRDYSYYVLLKYNDQKCNMRIFAAAICLVACLPSHGVTGMGWLPRMLFNTG